jgi:hypothetical protein
MTRTDHDDLDRTASLYRQAGMEPPWKRAYRDGVDITDEPRESWGWPFNPDALPPKHHRRR